MNINIISVGKLKEKFWIEAYSEYEKRLSKYAKIKSIEIKESNLEKETLDIRKHLRDNSFKIALDIEGKKVSSEELAAKIDEISLNSIGQIDFLIGGSIGLSDEIKKSCDFRLSFSDMTFTYQLSKVILIEQLYRAYKIRMGEKYHK